MNILIFLIVAFTVSAIQPYQEREALEAEMDHEGFSRQSQVNFENWMMENQRSYDNDFTMKHRMQIYMKNKKIMDEYNKEGHTDKYGLNQFSDMEDEEIMSKYMMSSEKLGEQGLHFEQKDEPYLFSNKHSSFLSTQTDQSTTIIPDSRSWKSSVPDVMNQGSCGSCWAFSTGDVVISRLVNADSKSRFGQASQQNLLDCTDKMCAGCNGCWPTHVLSHIKQYGFLYYDEYNGYNGIKNRCGKLGMHGKNMLKIVALKSFTDNDIINALQKGPVVATIRTSPSWFRYQSGFLDTCSYPDTNQLHAVALIGYDRSSWLLKNSWGAGWGEAGFFRIRRGQCNKFTNIDYPEYK